MKIMHAVSIAFAVLFIGVAHAAPPSVTDVEKTIASGDYIKAKSQLAEVLKVNPDSIVANKYMWEIIRIENSRDNQSSVEYKLYEDRVAKLEKVKADRLAAEKRVKEEKASKERMNAFFKLVLTMAILAIFGFFVWVGFNRFKVHAEAKRKQKEVEDWCAAVESDMLDIGNSLENALIRLASDVCITKTLMDLRDDNYDALGDVKNRDFSRDLVIRHIRNATQYLRERCGEDI